MAIAAAGQTHSTAALRPRCERHPLRHYASAATTAGSQEYRKKHAADAGRYDVVANGDGSYTVEGIASIDTLTGIEQASFSGSDHTNHTLSIGSPATDTIDTGTGSYKLIAAPGG